jgi:hypothetical protein
VVNKGFGKITITLSRGIVFGRFLSGTLTYSDQDTTDTVTNLPKVRGVDPTKVNDHVWTYGPAELVRFRSAGPTKLTVNAQSVDLSVAGKGKALLSVNGFSQDIAGKFSVDASSFCEDGFQKMPLNPTKVLISSPVAEQVPRFWHPRTGWRKHLNQSSSSRTRARSRPSSPCT